MDSRSRRKTVVVKLGGSVLVKDESYRSAAKYLVRRLHQSPEMRMVVVASARHGVTDELEGLARRITRYPNPRTVDLLWSTGEIHSVARLTLHLEELGVPVVGFNVHETGVRFDGGTSGEARIKALSAELRRAFYDHSIAVVPGFFGTLGTGTIVSLGRGGSDLTAVLLAEELGAEECELIKDVPGYFADDPKQAPQAEHLDWLSYERALDMAKTGCAVVQAKAIEAARDAGVRLRVRTMTESGHVSVVSERPEADESDGAQGCQPSTY